MVPPISTHRSRKSQSELFSLYVILFQSQVRAVSHSSFMQCRCCQILHNRLATVVVTRHSPNIFISVRSEGTKCNCLHDLTISAWQRFKFSTVSLKVSLSQYTYPIAEAATTQTSERHRHLFESPSQKEMHFWRRAQAQVQRCNGQSSARTFALLVWPLRLEP